MANPSKYATSYSGSKNRSNDIFTYTINALTVTSRWVQYIKSGYKDSFSWKGLQLNLPKLVASNSVDVMELALSGFNSCSSHIDKVNKNFKSVESTETLYLTTPAASMVLEGGQVEYSHTVWKAFTTVDTNSVKRVLGYRDDAGGRWGLDGDYYYLTWWCLNIDSGANTTLPSGINATLRVRIYGTQTYVNTTTYEMVSDSAISSYLGVALSDSDLNNLRITKTYSTTDNKITGTDGNILRTYDDTSSSSTYLTCSASSLKNGNTPTSTSWVLEVADSATGYTFGFEGNYSLYSPSDNWANSLTLSQTTFVVGQAFSVDAALYHLKNECSIPYSDGSSINASKAISSISGVLTYTENGTVKTLSSGSITLEKFAKYENPRFVATITMNWIDSSTGKNAVITKSYALEFMSTLVQSVSLSGVKTDFIYGEAYSYGDSATALITYTDGTSETMPVSDAASKSFLVMDSRVSNNTKITSFKDTDTLTTTPLANEGNAITNTIYISYVDGFKLAYTNLGKLYVNKDEATDLTEILGKVGTATATYHYNTLARQYTTSESYAYGNGLSASYTNASWSVDTSANRVTFKATSANTGQELSASATFDVYIVRPTGLNISHEAEQVYYEGRTNKFKIPSNLVIKKVYNNGNEVDLSDSEKVTLTYRASSDANGTILSETTALPLNATTIYVFITTDEGSTISGSYSIGKDYMPDPVVSVKFVKSVSFVLGNKMSTYNNYGDVVLHAVYTSSYEEDMTFGSYSFVSADYGDDPIITEKDATFYVAIDGVVHEVGYEDGVEISYSYPTASVSFVPPSETYVNTSDKVDFRNSVLKITYDGADSSMNVNATLDDGNEATASTYKVSSNEASLTAFNGSQTFNIADAGTTETRTFTVTAKNRFDGSSVTYTYSVKVLSVTSLNFEKIEITNPKLEYKVGETFLNETDTTQITLSCETAELTMNLRDAGSIVSVNPSKGLTFTKTNDSQQVTVTYSKNKEVNSSYTISVLASTSASVGKVSTLRAVLMSNSTSNPKPFDTYHAYYNTETPTSKDDIVCEGYYALVNDSDTAYSNGVRSLASGKKWSDVKIYGYIEDAFIKTCSARVILLEDHIPLVQSESNITVTFPCYVEGNSDLIDSCHIAKLFGNNNAKNRLFVSGNPDKANYDWHTAEVNSYVQTGETVDPNGDFTYFGDTSYCAYGQSDNRVLGYDNVATDKMVVLLSKSKIEPTNYFRGSGLGTAIDGGGNTVYDVSGTALSDEQFPCYTGNIGAGAMNRNSVINLNGDTLYLSSENTICGLDISGQVGDSQRISYSRSKYIDPELKGLDLSDAVLWTNNVIALLLTGDSAYMTNYETYSSETGQYEWWKTDVKGARCAIDVDNVVYFGCEDGSLLKADSSIFYDCDKVFIPEGGVIYGADTSYGEGKITYSERLNSEIDENGVYVFTMNPDSLQSTIYRRVALCDNSKRAGVDLFVDFKASVLRLIALDKDGKFDAERYAVMLDELADEDSWFYLNGPEGQTEIIGSSTGGYTEHYKRYKLKRYESEEDAYKLYDSDGNEVKLSYSVTTEGKTMYIYNLQSFDLCKALDGQYDVYDLDKASCTFKLKRHGRAINVLLYGDQSTGSYSYSSELHKHTPIKTYFICSPATLSGGVSYRKTLWAYTLTAFKEANDLEMCLATNEDNLEAMRSLAFADSVPVGFNLNDLSFSQVDFTKGNVPRKYTYFRPVSVPFACFGFRSEKAANSVLTTAQIVYSVPMMGRGNK